MHTPGPWVQFFDDGKPDSILPAMREGEVCRFADPRPSESDSSLIAAAPVLLNMLKWCVNHDGECLADHPELLEVARRAIAELEA